jgi:hypothetical protein
MARAKMAQEEMSIGRAKLRAAEAIEAVQRVAKTAKNLEVFADRAEVLTDMILGDTSTSEKEWESKIEGWRTTIWSLNGEKDFLEIQIENETYRVARKPFMWWCLWRTSASHLIPEWRPVCPSGVKRGGCSDDPIHTDWVLSAYKIENDKRVFADLEKWEYGYAESVVKAAHDRMSKVQQEICGFECSVLSGGGGTMGKVVHPGLDETVGKDQIAVIPYAKPGYLAAALTAKAVITGEGGELCHLAQESRSKGILVVRVPDCKTRFPVGSTVQIDAIKGTVNLLALDVRGL